jgi:hypothetical protein
VVVLVKNVAKYVGQEENITTPCQFLAMLSHVFSLSQAGNSDILRYKNKRAFTTALTDQT